MDCSKYRQSLHAYASGSLSELEMQAVATHLGKCEKCRKEAEEIDLLRGFFAECTPKAPAPDEEMRASVLAAIDLTRYKPVRKAKGREMANWGMSLVAAGLILLIISITPNGESLMQSNMSLIKLGECFGEKLSQPISRINNGINGITDSIIQLDGISGRLEKGKKGGN